MFSLWTASSFTSRNIASAPLALALMPIHYWVAIRASQEIRPKISVELYPRHGLTGYRNLPQLESADSHLNTFIRGRSEEHTSELQSLRHLVCRLLLEKK